MTIVLRAPALTICTDPVICSIDPSVIVPEGTVMTSEPGELLACWTAARSVQTPALVAQIPSERLASAVSRVLVTVKVAADAGTGTATTSDPARSAVAPHDSTVRARIGPRHLPRRSWSGPYLRRRASGPSFVPR